MRSPTADQDGSVISIPVPTEAPVAFDTAQVDTEPELTLTAPWIEGGAIPARFTCRGGDAAPMVSWSDSPVGTVSFALVLVDTTQVTESSIGFIHWVAYNIDANVTSLDAAALPAGVVAANSDFGTPDSPVTTWRGPCPPVGQTHTYVLELHALDQMLDVMDGSSAADVVRAIDAATIDTASITASDTGV